MAYTCKHCGTEHDGEPNAVGMCGPCDLAIFPDRPRSPEELERHAGEHARSSARELELQKEREARALEQAPAELRARARAPSPPAAPDAS